MIRRFEEDARELAEELDDAKSLWDAVARLKQKVDEVKLYTTSTVMKADFVWDAVAEGFSIDYMKTTIEQAEKQTDRMMQKAIELMATIYKMQEYIEKEELKCVNLGR